MDKSIIAWTDSTFNPWMGCCKVSEGCRNCYAETLTRNRMGLSLWGPSSTTGRQRTKAPWRNVRKWEREAANGFVGILGGAPMPRLVFCGSLMDWAEDHPQLDAWRADLWDVIRQSPHLHFQMLTKRADRISHCLPDDWGQGYANVWLGVSIENIDVAPRADYLRDVPARVRFISYEPALGPLDQLDLNGIHWVIYGGESGPGYRSEDKAWARSMRDKCHRHDIAFFHKQSSSHRTEMGIELDGEMVREFPRLPL